MRIVSRLQFGKLALHERDNYIYDEEFWSQRMKNLQARRNKKLKRAGKIHG